MIEFQKFNDSNIFRCQIYPHHHHRLNSIFLWKKWSTTIESNRNWLEFLNVYIDIIRFLLLIFRLLLIIMINWFGHLFGKKMMMMTSITTTTKIWMMFGKKFKNFFSNKLILFLVVVVVSLSLFLSPEFDVNLIKLKAFTNERNEMKRKWNLIDWHFFSIFTC